MKTRQYIYAALVLTSLLASCSKDFTSMADADAPLEMKLQPALAGETKASMQTSDLTEFWLQVENPQDPAYNYFTKVTKSGDAWNPADKMFWKNSSASVNYSAAYFGNHNFIQADFVQGVDLTVPTDQSTQAGLNSADLLTLKATQTSYEKTDNGTLSVALSHGLVKVNFKLTLGDAFYDAKLGLTANPVTAFTVKGANTGFNFKPQTGDITVTTGTAADITPLPGTYTPASATSKTATAVYEAILVPQTFTAGALSVSFSVGQGNYVWTNATAITLTAGTTVNLPLSATTAPPKPTINGHEYVDLGLPSGLKWATCNVGATAPEEYGDYFAWGDTVPYYSSQDQDPLTWKEGKSDGYDWPSYTWCKGSYNTLTKYCYNGNYGNNGFTDSKTTLELEDDAARYQWGGSWRMPTKDDCQELLNNCTIEWKQQNGVYGRLFTSNKNGATLFLPAAGFCDGTYPIVGSNGLYWSSSLSTDAPFLAWYIDFSSSDVGASGNFRYGGQSVRPVCP